MKPKLFMILSRFPYPLEKGDKLRAYYQLRELSKDFRIHLVCLSDTPVSIDNLKQIHVFCEELYVFRLTPLGLIWRILVQLFSDKPFQVAYFYSHFIHLKIKKILTSIKPDHVYCQLIRTSEYVKNYHACPKTIDYMDTLSIGMKRRSEISGEIKRIIQKEEAKRLRAYEMKVFDYFENHLIISEQDRSFIAHPDRNKISIVPNGIDLSFFEEKPDKPEFDLVFIGNLSYSPNVEAASFLIKTLLPQLPNRKLLLAGASPHPRIIKLTARSPYCSLIGWTENIRETYRKGKIFIAPMHIGTGMQNKLLEAMALGIPSVTTSLVNNAIRGKHREHLLVADNLSQMVNCIKELENDQELRLRIIKNARAFVRERYSWQTSVKELKAIFLGQS
jgi:glycosyltransferase involved in cell wall biosynthesis